MKKPKKKKKEKTNKKKMKIHSNFNCNFFKFLIHLLIFGIGLPNRPLTIDTVNALVARISAICSPISLWVKIAGMSPVFIATKRKKKVKKKFYHKIVMWVDILSLCVTFTSHLIHKFLENTIILKCKACCIWHTINGI